MKFTYEISSPDPALSILIPTIPRRVNRCEFLVDKIKRIGEDFPIELITCFDEIKYSIGHKRQKLLEKSKGRYICFVDDDDDLDRDYFKMVFEGINLGVDCIAFRGYQDDIRKKRPRRYLYWTKFQDVPKKANHTKIGISHLNPVKRELSLKAGFPNISCGEDQKYTSKLMPLIKTEHYIDKPIYSYLCDYRHKDVAINQKRIMNSSREKK